MDRIINSENILSFDLETINLNFNNDTEFLGFEPINNDLKYTNNGDFLNFELKSYHSAMPIYGIILDFMFETGGVY